MIGSTPLNVSPLNLLKKKKKKVVEEPKKEVVSSTAPPPVDTPQITPPVDTPEQIARTRGPETSFTLPDGRTFFGLNTDDIAQLQKTEQKQNLAIEQQKGFETAGQTDKARQIYEKFKGQPLPQDVLNSMTPSEIDWYQAVGSGASGAVPGIIGGAVAGGVAGAAVGGFGAIPGAIGGAVIGGIGTFASAVRSNVAAQRSGTIQAQKLTLPDYEKNLRMIVQDINNGGNAITDTQSFYETVTDIQISHAQLHLDGESYLTRGVGKDATPELKKYQVFMDKTLPSLEKDLRLAIDNPDPSVRLVDNSEVGIEE